MVKYNEYFTSSYEYNNMEVSSPQQAAPEKTQTDDELSEIFDDGSDGSVVHRPSPSETPNPRVVNRESLVGEEMQDDVREKEAMMRNYRSLGVTMCCLCCISLVGMIVIAAWLAIGGAAVIGGPLLFNESGESLGQMSTPMSMEPQVIRSRLAVLNPEALLSLEGSSAGTMARPGRSLRTMAEEGSEDETGEATVVTLNLFDDVSIHVVIKETKQLDVVRWRLYGFALDGEGVEVPEAPATINIRNNQVSAEVFDPATMKKYEIVSVGGDAIDSPHLIEELDYDVVQEMENSIVDAVDIPRDYDDEYPDPMSVDDGVATTMAVGSAEGGGAKTMTTDADGNTIIDCMVVYFPRVRLALGSTDSVISLAEQSILNANDAAQYSGGSFRFRLVGTYELTSADYGDNDDSTQGHSYWLGALQKSSDGVIDHVHTLRSQYGADTVSLWLNNNSGGGLGYVVKNSNPGYKYWAFNTVHYSYAAGYYTWAHETGHNLGNCHDRDVSDEGCGAHDYSYGYRWKHGSTTKYYRTIMAYGGSPYATRLKMYSTPNKSYTAHSQTETIGTANDDNTRSQDNMVSSMAGYFATTACTGTPTLTSSACGAVSGCRFDSEVSNTCVTSDYGVGAGCAKVEKAKCNLYSGCSYCTYESACKASSDTCVVPSCAKGTYAQTDGTCTICPRGKYNDQVGQTACTDCPAGTYNDQAAATSSLMCKSCPQTYQWSAAGSDNVNDCAATTCSTGRVAVHNNCVAKAPRKVREFKAFVPTGSSDVRIRFLEPDTAYDGGYTNERSTKCRVKIYEPDSSTIYHTATINGPTATYSTDLSEATYFSKAGKYKFVTECFNNHNSINSAGADAWGSPLTSFATFTSGHISACATGTKRCPDGTCVAETANCPTKSCSSGQELCADGTCTSGTCPGYNGCPIGQVQCSDYSCQDSSDLCPMCSDPTLPYRCGDGSCAADKSSCPEPRWKKKCKPVSNVHDGTSDNTVEATDSTGASTLARLVIGASALPASTTISISDVPDSYIHESVTHTASQVYSTLVEVAALDAAGSDVFTGSTGTSVTVQLRVTLPAGVDIASACLGYYDTTTKKWACEDTSVTLVSGETDLYEASTTHFTPFGIVDTASATSGGTTTSNDSIVPLLIAGFAAGMVPLASCLCLACLCCLACTGGLAACGVFKYVSKHKKDSKENVAKSVKTTFNESSRRISTLVDNASLRPANAASFHQRTYSAVRGNEQAHMQANRQAGLPPLNMNFSPGKGRK